MIFLVGCSGIVHLLGTCMKVRVYIGRPKVVMHWSDNV